MTGELFEPSRGAELSSDGRYRLSLWRRWAATGPTACWVLLNPSTADAEQDDPTLRRCVSFSQAAGCAALELVNLFAYRATSPTALVRAARAGVDVIGPECDAAIAAAAARAAVIVVGWGIVPTGLRKLTLPDRVRYRHREVFELLGGRALTAGGSRDRVRCLGHTTGGWPRHPLYVPGDRQLAPF